MSKAAAQRKHARRRLRERYGIDADDAMVDVMVDTIRAGDATYVRKQSNRVSVYDVHVDGQVVRVAYDSNRRTIITALPPHSSEEDDRLNRMLGALRRRR